GVRQEVRQLHVLLGDALQVAEDHLQRALEKLHLALDAQEIAFVKGAEKMLAGIPESAGDGARAVAELQLQVKIAVAVGAQLLFSEKVYLFFFVAIRQMLNEPPPHAESLSFLIRSHADQVTGWRFFESLAFCPLVALSPLGGSVQPPP